MTSARRHCSGGRAAPSVGAVDDHERRHIVQHYWWILVILFVAARLGYGALARRSRR
jgi:hypothetical protein